MYFLETKNLSYGFKHAPAVLNTMDLRVPERSIYGFLGPNGAGKTTTLRLVTGLLKKQEGEIFIIGQELEKSRLEILRNVGSLIESPSFYSHLTAVENLTLLQKVYRCPPSRIGYVLDLVGLSKTGSKKLGQFSLGMKQRMGIAIALLNNPALLILDEPTNGLDPAGIIEMRELLLQLNRQHGTTILISSHLLAEMEKLVTHLGIINRGNIVFQGPFAELEGGQNASYVSLETSDRDKALAILTGVGLAPALMQQKIRIWFSSRDALAQINRQLVEGGVDIYEVRIVKNNLETIFMNLINPPAA